MLIPRIPSFVSSSRKEVYNPRAVILHAASLRQTCVHCGKFPTAASRRSLDRVSVPMWLSILSDQLLIVAIVRHYHTIQLIRRKIIFRRNSFHSTAYRVLASVSRSYPRPKGRFLRVTHPFATLISSEDNNPVRLACVMHAASVPSEPGSNSP